MATLKHHKLHIKVGDKVKVIAGASKGSQGEVKEIMRSSHRAIVDGVNLVKKHTKPTNDTPGGINEVEAGIHISNLMVVDPSTGDATRTGRKKVDGRGVRFSKKSGEIIK
jgi:large subunit ribosomal protein L24